MDENTEIIDSHQEDDDGEIRRRVVRKTTYQLEDDNSTTTTTKTTTMTARKLYGKDLSDYDNMDVDELLSQLTTEELDLLSREVDPDDSLLPASQRSGYLCRKDATGPLDRKQLIEHINKIAMETPDIPELKPYVAGTIRGKKWIAPEKPPTKQEEEISVDMGDEYEQALTTASEEELVDLAAILGFHSMMNQEQYHNSLLNKIQPKGLGWNGTAKAYQPKPMPFEPPNMTDVEKSIKQLDDDDYTLMTLNLNNIQVTEKQFYALFEALKTNTHLESLSLCNTGITDRTGLALADALTLNMSLKTINVETNNLSPTALVALIKSLLSTRYIEEFRASNQRQQTLGNKIEMEITGLVEQNPTLLRVGLHLEYNDARNRVATHLQRNLDRTRLRRMGRAPRNVLLGLTAVNRPK